MQAPLISIIIPVYNVESYLRQCVDSVISQTYTNLEIILVDDESPDRCPAICDEYAAKGNRVVVIHKENGGLSDARNAGMQKATGKYIFFLDGDDFLQEYCIETLVAVAEAEKTDVAMANIQYPPFLSDISVKSFSYETLEGENIIYGYYKGSFLPCACNKLYRTTFLTEHQLEFRKGLLFEDQLWCCQWITFAKKICLLPIKSYCYNQRFDSITHSTKINLQKRINSWKIILSEIKKIQVQHNVDDFHKNLFFIYKIEEILRNTTERFADFKYAYHEIQEAIQISPLHYWKKNTPLPKKIIFLLLSSLPTTFQAVLLFHHIK